MKVFGKRKLAFWLPLFIVLQWLYQCLSSTTDGLLFWKEAVFGQKKNQLCMKNLANTLSEVLRRQQEVGFLWSQDKPKWGKFKLGMQTELTIGSGKGQMPIHGYFREECVGKSF